MKDNSELYLKIKDEMQKKRLTLKELASLIDERPSQLSNKLSRLKRNKSVHTCFLFKIEKALKKKIFFK